MTPSPRPARSPKHAAEVLVRLGVELSESGDVVSRSPINGETLTLLPSTPARDVDAAVTAAADAFGNGDSYPRRVAATWYGAWASF